MTMLQLPGEGPSVLIRSGTADDAAFIFDTWLKHYRMSDASQLVQGPLYYREQRERVRRTLARPGALVAIAAEPADATHLYGWVVGERPEVSGLFLLHYAYVKSQFRRFGLFRALLGELRRPGEDLVATHLPPKDQTSILGGGSALLRKIGAAYNPYRA